MYIYIYKYIFKMLPLLFSPLSKGEDGADGSVEGLTESRRGKATSE